MISLRLQYSVLNVLRRIALQMLCRCQWVVEVVGDTEDEVEHRLGEDRLPVLYHVAVLCEFPPAVCGCRH